MDAKLAAGLVIALFLAGCTTGGSGNPREGEETESVGDALHITDPTCSTATGSCSTINQYVNPTVEMTVKNNGSRPVGIVVRPLLPYASSSGAEAFNALSRSVLRSRCPKVFSMRRSSFTLRKITTERPYVYKKKQGKTTPDVVEGSKADFGYDGGSWETMTVKPGTRLEFEWVFRYKNTEELPKRATCSLSFGLNTSQDVSAFKEVQIRKNADVNIVDIQTRSSPAPMAIKFDAPDSWVADEEFPVSVWMENKKDGVPFGIRYYTGDSPSSDQVKPADSSGSGISCDPIRSGPIAFREGDTNEQTTGCTGTLSGGTSSQVYPLFLKARFNYFYDLGAIDMEVEREE